VQVARRSSRGSDEELEGEFLSCAPGTKAIDLPLYISPIAVIFKIDGVSDLALSPDALASIFKGDITRWDDPALVELNPGVPLPDAPITAVHRADDSGTTKNFVDYLHATAPSIWTAEPDDRFPYQGGESAQGNSGIVSAVTNGVNTIGYADASKAADLDIARLQVGDEFVVPTAEAAARIAELSPRVPGRAEHDLAIQVDRTSNEPGVYPLVLISYLIVCEEYADPADAVLVKAFVSHVASDLGQQEAAEFAGSAPITPALAEEVQRAVDAIR
jgi:phosphate transport system substrate-binding protein